MSLNIYDNSDDCRAFVIIENVSYFATEFITEYNLLSAKFLAILMNKTKTKVERMWTNPE